MFTFDGFLCTCDNCGLFQLTGTKALELEPEEVEEVLLVTAITFGFPFLPAALGWSPYLFPIIGVCIETKMTVSDSDISALKDWECIYEDKFFFFFLQTETTKGERLLSMK